MVPLVQRALSVTQNTCFPPFTRHNWRLQEVPSAQIRVCPWAHIVVCLFVCFLLHRLLCHNTFDSITVTASCGFLFLRADCSFGPLGTFRPYGAGCDSSFLQVTAGDVQHQRLTPDWLVCVKLFNASLVWLEFKHNIPSISVCNMWLKKVWLYS